MIKITESGIQVIVRVIPNSSKNCILKEESCIKVKLTAPPVDNKANISLIEFLSKKLHVAKTNIEIIKGSTSKDKVILLKIKDTKIQSDILNKLKNEATNI